MILTQYHPMATLILNRASRLLFVGGKAQSGILRTAPLRSE